MDIANVFELKEFKKGMKIAKKVVDSKNIVIHFLFYAPNAEIPLHRHEGSENIFYIIEGEGLVTVENEKQTLEKGDIIFIPENTTHGVVNTSRKQLIIMDILAPRSRASK